MVKVDIWYQIHNLWLLKECSDSENCDTSRTPDTLRLGCALVSMHELYKLCSLTVSIWLPFVKKKIALLALFMFWRPQLLLLRLPTVNYRRLKNSHASQGLPTLHYLNSKSEQRSFKSKLKCCFLFLSFAQSHSRRVWCALWVHCLPLSD